MHRTYCLLVAVLLMSSASEAQLFSDPGQFSGSGLTIIPTAMIAPPMEYRVHINRMNFLGGHSRGLNLMTLTAGLSSTIEGYMRFGSEQSGSFASQVAYGFGGKFRLPMLLPVLRRVAFWTEITSTDQPVRSAIFPSDVVRGGVSATLDSNGIHPTVLFGLTKVSDKSNVLIGAGVTIAAGNSKQVGFEIVQGYLGHSSLQVVASGSMRIFNNIGIHLSPGYLSSSAGSTATISLGISFSTTDIDFHPVIEEKTTDDFILPSIEDIEKQEQGGQQQPSGSEVLPGNILPDNGMPQSNSVDGSVVITGSVTDKTLSQQSLKSNQQKNNPGEGELKEKKEKHD